jgi:hypothetical protein
MKKTRLIGMILAHVGILLSIAYLVFFLVCTVKADQTVSALNDPEASVSEQDLYLQKSIEKDGFSILTVGKALQEKDSTFRETLLLILDLIIPLLCIASGVLLQIASVHKKPTLTVASQRSQYDHITTSRRQP